MEEIVNKVHTDLLNYADAKSGEENVTLRLTADFRRALFLLLDEKTRINDLEKSEELKQDMMASFGKQDPKEDSWPFLDQPGILDRCYAKLGCKFKLGSGLYKSSCGHFMCCEHKSSLCIANHRTTNQSNLPESISKERGKTQDLLDEKKSGLPEALSKEEEEYQAQNTKGGDEGILFDDSNTNSDGKEVVNDKETVLPEVEGVKNRAVKFEVEDPRNFSVADFDFKKEDHMLDLQVCQVRTKQGGFIWILEKDYVQLKEDHINIQAIDDSSDEEGVVTGERMNQQNADVGK